MNASRIAFFMIGILLVAPASADESPAALVEALLVPWQALINPSPADSARLAAAQKAPDAYVAAVRARYANLDVSTLRSDEKIAELQRACILVDRLDTPEARDQIAKWYLRLDDAIAKSPHPPKALLAFRETTLARVRRSHPEVTAHLVQRLPKLSYGERINALLYFQRAALNDGSIRDRLRAFHEDARSPLYHAADLSRAINAMGAK